jgi:Tol biopolymer transport system component
MNREIYRMKPDGSSVQRMTRTADGVDDGAPDISPDGRRVVFSSTRGNGDQDLWTMRPDGTDARRLGSGEEIRDEVFPQWAAGGETVLYWQFGDPDGSRDTIRVIGADGTGDRALTNGRANDWSPDPYPLPRG